MVKPVDAWLLPDGVADVLPAEAARLESLRRRLLDLFSSWGYDLVFPPLMEFLESLLTGSGRDLAEQTFTITDQLSGRLMGVRADMTPQVARLDAHCLPVAGAARYCYAGTLMQTRPAGLSSSRCPVQIGAELYGHAGVESDIEIIRLMLDGLALAGARDIHLDLGHVGIFRALAVQAGLDAGREAALQDILVRKSLPEWADAMTGLEAQTLLTALPTLCGDLAVLERTLQADAPAAVQSALRDLQSVAAALRQSHPQVTLYIDLSELRGYHYHTGLVFAAYVPGQPAEVAKGGRYDHVGEAFGRARPATGFSADLKQWLAFDAKPALRPAILAPAIDDAGLYAAVAALRQSGERVLHELPGTGVATGCDRVLVAESGAWVVRPLNS
ncbi:ATP phosphoribosyltransferase regulatory subunit [Perlucidibaca piscinae]|uniref:ATP phosphoribosyltransferase regulatory subunit n=1 Tax=Perlucidibaca piscinae TaxID=392589 RepID=UPI0003B3EAE7|nr:ATP phosphoribosyltransferase regulatory subunit [Perlucidibaca piscinae]